VYLSSLKIFLAQGLKRLIKTTTSLQKRKMALSAFVRGFTHAIAIHGTPNQAAVLHVVGAVVSTAVAFHSIDARYIDAQTAISIRLLRERLSYHEKEALLRKKQENLNLSIMAHVDHVRVHRQAHQRPSQIWA
jgi:hypothetical protein